MSHYNRRNHMILMLQYLLLSIAGILALIKPTPNVYDLMPTLVVYVWGIFFALGGIVSCLGVTTGFREGEAIGVPLLSSACIMYGSALLYQSTNQGPASFFVFLFVGLFSVSYGVGLLDRWVSSLHVVNVSRETQ